MEIDGSSKRHRHVNSTGGDGNEDDDEDAAATAMLLKNNTSKILRQWHQPGSRIYRVSRASGGKDRHSKVYTAKGLRDRRVRLSVSTAIQFYDLQDRLGYDQPSKAIEWLIKAADSAIAELPSLDMNLIDLARPKQEMVIAHIADANRQSSASETSKGSIRVKARERARERAVQNMNPQSSFTELLTRGGVGAEENIFQKYMPPVTTTADYFTQLKSSHGHHHHHQSNIPSEFGFGDHHPAEMQQFDHFFPVGNGGGGGDNYNLNFSISSGLAGFHRETLQSNSPYIHHQFPHPQHLPFLFGTAASAATSAHEGQCPAGFDGHHLQHLEMKGKGKG